MLEREILFEALSRSRGTRIAYLAVATALNG